jgi:DNA replication and repair protein RecF
LILRSISLKNFRNFSEAAASFAPGLNAICGANGQGKTSIIEAINIVSSGKSFRAKENTEVIRNGSEYAIVEAEAEKQKKKVEDSIRDRYRVFISADRKQYMINGGRTNTEDFYGDFGCVLMSDRDMLLLRGNPEERRRFIDRAISNTDKIYLVELLRFNRTLRQRNALLRHARETRMPVAKLKGEVKAWDYQLAESADLIMTKREGFTAKLKDRIGGSYKSLFGSHERLEMSYEPSVKKKLGIMGRNFQPH